MSAIDDSRALGRTRLSFASQADLDEFVTTLDRFERGELTADEWRAFRLVRGVYGQRHAEDGQMLRVKIPQGALSAAQLDALVDVAEQYSRGFGHITTRQNVQFHFVELHDTEPAMRRLAAEGLTTREACGNSVRNITACPYAGVAGDEVFDVTPYAEALTRYFLRHPLSSSLPRKFKIAFEGCADDHVATAINDIGWRARARVQAGRRELGFRVTVGGGTSTMTRAGYELFEFLPAGEMFNVAEAILRVFHRLGDYQHKARNRMKFLIKQLGWEQWHAEFERELAAVRAGGGAILPFDPDNPPVEHAPDWPHDAAPAPRDAAARAERSVLRGPGLHPTVVPRLTVTSEAFDAWLRTNVRLQKQRAFAAVTIRLELGDLTGEQMRLAGDLARSYGDGTVRVTPEQNLVFRWVRRDDLPPFYTRLAAAGLRAGDAMTIRDVTSCPGAESCRLAVTQSRGLGGLLGDHLDEHRDIVEAAPDVVIKISGCPNGCGQHHVATIGFQGSVRKVGGRAVPHYFVMVGGGPTADSTTFARLAAKVPARRAPEALDRLIALYRERRETGESAPAFFRRIDVATVSARLRDLEAITPERLRAEDYIDLGETEAFEPEVQEGECAAP
jgi:sulfite reductase (NADPH) hemoprotein beta-component